MNKKLLDYARKYLNEGAHVIPIPHKQKAPEIKDWQHLRLKSDELEHHFKNRSSNIGILCGEPSGGLVDVDLDCDEALVVAQYLLPKTGQRHGRKSNPNSHFWYRMTGQIPKSVHFQDISTGGSKRTTLLEIRSTGSQTIVPPSLHPSGEEVYWEEKGEPAKIDGNELIRFVRIAAAATLLARHWPNRGSRNECALALGSVLLKNNFSVNDAELFIKTVAKAANDEEWQARANSINATYEKMRNKEPVIGLPRLAVSLGDSVVRKFCEFLDFPNEEKGKQKASQLALKIALESELFHDDRDRAYVRVKFLDHYENWPLFSNQYKSRLAKEFNNRRGEPPGNNDLDNALRVMDAYAMERNQYKLSVRIASQEDSIWIDLVDRDWRAIQVQHDGWRLVKDVPILFRRHVSSAEQVEPAHGGDLEMLRPFLNVQDDDAWMLNITWIVASFIPDIPHPVLVVHGEQGTAKSTHMRIMSALIDPSKVPLRAGPSDLAQWAQTADHSWLITLDNISSLQPWLSDALCRCVTGDAFIKRKLYTDEDDILFAFRRVVALTGIEVVAQNSDLLNRSILLGLEPIMPTQRRTEQEVLAGFESIRPQILGAILDTLVKILPVYQKIELHEMPRMADFARVGVALEGVLGWSRGAFMKAYNRNIISQDAEALASSSVVEAILTFTSENEKWKGTASNLLDLLTDIAGGENRPPQDWPRSPRKLSVVLRRLAPSLRTIGVYIKFNASNGTRWVYLEKRANLYED